MPNHRQFDYTQKILLAVEFGSAPRQLADMPPTYSIFQRLSIPEVVRAFEEAQSPFVRLIAGSKFRRVLNQRMGYWEERIPAGQQCYVHYAIGTSDVITRTFDALKQAADGWVQLGIYHLEPQCSSYPFGFPVSPTPSHWDLGKTHEYTKESVFWFNFFPAQDYLFEKTFAVWVLFNLSQLKEGGECNQLVAWEGKDRLLAPGIDAFVQVNLNRFTSLAGYFNAAREAGKHTFAADSDYRWYGMLLRKV